MTIDGDWGVPAGSLTLPPFADPDAGAIILGPDLPPCMQADYSAAIFWRPPGAVSEPAPYFFIAQVRNIIGSSAQIVDHGFLIYSGSTCNYGIYKRVTGIVSGTDLFVQEAYGTSPITGLTLTELEITYNHTNVFMNSDTGRIAVQGDTLTGRVRNSNGFATANATASVAGAYIDWPGALVSSFEKLYDATHTRLLIRFAPTHFTDSLTAGCEYAVRISGTDYRTHRIDPAIATQRRLPSFGERTISGLNANTYSIQGRFALIGTGNNFVTQDDDFHSLTIEEIAED